MAMSYPARRSVSDGDGRSRARKVFPTSPASHVDYFDIGAWRLTLFLLQDHRSSQRAENQTSRVKDVGQMDNLPSDVAGILRQENGTGAGGAVLMVHALDLVYTSAASCSKDSVGRASGPFTMMCYHSLLRKWH